MDWTKPLQFVFGIAAVGLAGGVLFHLLGVVAGLVTNWLIRHMRD